jgi:hypothetical protein
MYATPPHLFLLRISRIEPKYPYYYYVLYNVEMLAVGVAISLAPYAVRFALGQCRIRRKVGVRVCVKWGIVGCLIVKVNFTIIWVSANLLGA